MPEKRINNNYSCTVIGDVTIDTFLLIDHAHLSCDVRGEHCEICFDFGAKIPIQSSAQSVGGNAANVSFGLKKFGVDVHLCSELGDDLNGHVAYEELNDAGVDMQLVKQKKGKQTRYSIVVNYTSDRTVFSYHAPRRYTLPKLSTSDWIYYTSLGASFELLQEKLITHLNKHPHVRLVVNPGSYQIHQGIRTLRKILPHIDLLFVNKEEAALLLGKEGTIEALAQALHKKGVVVVVVTDGEAGSYAFDGTNLMSMMTYPIPPVSKTGAGDAYASGFLASYMKDGDIHQAMRYGTANAGGVVQKIGGNAGLLSDRQVQLILKQYPHIVPQIILSK